MQQKSSRITRLLRLITLLETEAGLPGDTLASRLNISRRTLFRDLKTLQQAGVPCFHERKVGYRIRRGFFLPPTNLTSPELVSLHVLLKVTDADTTVPMRSSLQTAIRKLLSSMDESKIQACESLMQHIATPPTTRIVQDDAPPITSNYKTSHKYPLSRKSTLDSNLTPDRGWRWFSLLLQAINDRRVCNITQHTSDTPNLFEPHRLYVHNTHWYTVGRPSPRAAFNLIRLDHITAIERTNIPFHPAPTLDIPQLTRNAWHIHPEEKTYTISLHLHPDHHHFLEHTWHPSQTITHSNNGNATLHFKVDGLSEIAAWIAPRVQAFTTIKPEALRKKVIAHIDEQLTHAQKL